MADESIPEHEELVSVYAAGRLQKPNAVGWTLCLKTASQVV